MKDGAIRQDDALTSADRAVKYALDRIQHDPNVRYYCGPGTQMFYLLIQAEAVRTGESLEVVEKRRQEVLLTGDDKRKPDVVDLRAELERLREKHEDWD